LKDLNILLVIPRFYPKSGGGVIVVSNVAKFLKKKGHSVTILTTDYNFDESFSQILIEKGVQIIKIKSGFSFFSFIYSPELKRWCDENLKNFDVIHFNWTRAYQNNIISKYAEMYNVPYVIQPHGSINSTTNMGFLFLLYDLVWGNRIYDCAARFIALSESEKKKIAERTKNRIKIEIIPNGIDIANYDREIKKGYFRKHWNIPDSENIVLYTGRIHESKGLDKLILSLHKILITNDNYLVILAGKDDHYLSTINKLIYQLGLTDHVIITGYLTEEEKFQAYVDSDVFVTPRFYGLPITFLESCYFGLPIVTTDGGDFLEWINDKIGFSTRFDEKEISESILKITQNKNVRDRFSENAKFLIKEKLNWEKIVDDIVDLYRDSIEDKKIVSKSH